MYFKLFYVNQPRGGVSDMNKQLVHAWTRKIACRLIFHQINAAPAGYAHLHARIRPYRYASTMTLMLEEQQKSRNVDVYLSS